MLWTREMLRKLSAADVRSIARSAKISLMGTKDEVINRIIQMAPSMGSTTIEFVDPPEQDCEVCQCGDEVESIVKGPGGEMMLCEDHAGMLTEALEKLGVAWK